MWGERERAVKIAVGAHLRYVGPCIRTDGRTDKIVIRSAKGGGGGGGGGGSLRSPQLYFLRRWNLLAS